MEDLDLEISKKRIYLNVFQEEASRGAGVKTVYYKLDRLWVLFLTEVPAADTAMCGIEREAKTKSSKFKTQCTYL